MRVLWITNIMLPPICEAMNYPAIATGGWLFSSLERIQEINDIDFAVATVYNGRELLSKEIENVKYYLLPLNGQNNTKYQQSLEKYWVKVRDDFRPDIVHIHGTEFAHSLAYLNACGYDNVIVSIQGLVSVIARYYCAGISKKEILRNITFRDILRRDSVLEQQKKFYKRGEIEKEYIRSVKHVIGRTSWDKTHVRAINPDIHYHFCNETLRDEFYKHTWNYESCEKHSIFSSQAGYPIKGLHQLLKAMPLILREYPDTKLYVAGGDITKSKWYRLSGYASYIKRLIEENGLRDMVNFSGMLSEKDMCARYLRSNVFVCPSAIENSPNSLGEAQLLGVPCIAAYVGGVPDMMREYEGNMYRFEEVEMLAEKICEIFSQKSNTAIMNREIALQRHNSKLNAEQIYRIYTSI